MSTTTVNPLPSLLRASAEDEANRAMRKAGRSAWSRSDYNVACEKQECLIRSCYGRDTDKDPNFCYIRFGVAEQLQRDGYIGLRSDWKQVMEGIDKLLAGSPATFKRAA